MGCHLRFGDSFKEGIILGSICTEYGIITGITSVNFYLTGEIEECMINKENKINVMGKMLIPLYDYSNGRKKYIPGLTFYKSGSIKTISLNKSEVVETKEGTFQVEKLSFYEEGGIKRLFLLDGKLSAYWTEDDEYNLAKYYDFKFDFGEFKAKIISIQLYLSQKIKSITLWPKEIINIETDVGKIQVRIGLGLYESGRLRSCEPYKPTKVSTPIGIIQAYDANAIGIHGETNSLNFYEDGTIKSLKTTTNFIEVYNIDGKKAVHEPKETLNHFNNDILDTIPLYLEFEKDIVRIDNKYEYSLQDNNFKIGRYGQSVFTLAGDCTNCFIK